MKKIISIALLLALCLSIFAACGDEPAQTKPQVDPLKNAAEYLFTMYKPASKDEPTKLTADKEITAVVVIDGTTYQVNWTVEITSGPAGAVTIGTASAANHVKIDIMDQPEEDIYYTLTATISDGNGKTETVSFKYFTPKVKKVEINDDGKIVIFNPGDGKYVTETEYLYTSSSSGNSKYELVLSENKDEAVALTVRKNDDGSVTFITDSGKYLFCDGNNVQFVAEESENTKFFLEAAADGQYIKTNVIAYDKPQYIEVYSGYLTCYGMNAEKAGLYTFELQPAEGGNMNAAILDAAYSLGEGESLEGEYTLTGVITKIDTAWSDQYGNITVTIVCDGDTARPMMCYRLKGEGAKDLAVGDKITVTGMIKNYNGTIEFDAGCNLDKVVKADGTEVKPEQKPESDVTVVPEFTAPFANGDKIVIVATSYNMAFSTQPAESNNYYQKGVAVTVADGTVTGYAETEVWTVIVNDDGTYSFQQGEQTIGMQDSYSSMGMGHPNNKWELIALSNGSFLLKNVARGNYMQWTTQHGNWSTYAPSAPEADEQYHLSFFVVG